LVEQASVAVKSLLAADPGLNSPDGRRCRDHLRAVWSDDVAAASLSR